MPRPAMLVEIVTAPRSPARAMICASCSSCLAFRTSQRDAAARSVAPSCSDSCDAGVPTRIGGPCACARCISLHDGGGLRRAVA